MNVLRYHIRGNSSRSYSSDDNVISYMEGGINNCFDTADVPKLLSTRKNIWTGSKLPSEFIEQLEVYQRSGVFAPSRDRVNEHIIAEASELVSKGDVDGLRRMKLTKSYISCNGYDIVDQAIREGQLEVLIYLRSFKIKVSDMGDLESLHHIHKSPHALAILKELTEHWGLNPITVAGYYKDMIRGVVFDEMKIISKEEHKRSANLLDFIHRRLTSK